VSGNAEFFADRFPRKTFKAAEGYFAATLPQLAISSTGSAGVIFLDGLKGHSESGQSGNSRSGRGN
jgi:hypothetical protein